MWCRFYLPIRCVCLRTYTIGWVFLLLFFIYFFQFFNTDFGFFVQSVSVKENFPVKRVSCYLLSSICSSFCNLQFPCCRFSFQFFFFQIVLRILCIFGWFFFLFYFHLFFFIISSLSPFSLSSISYFRANVSWTTTLITRLAKVWIKY